MSPGHSQLLIAEELLGGAFVRLDAGDPDGALACALEALKIGSGRDAVAEARLAVQRTCARQVCEEILRRGGILADNGHAMMLQRALEDGTSVVCMRCGAIVSQERMEPHRTSWCPVLPEEQPSPSMSDCEMCSMDITDTAMEIA
eukprot:TRINITY_DN56638_c0_g1_i1.p1 TRINITY_DN56638_c0_g1~~TRINITY_DN56638_c0_g1_i1.p1  ORF type:complete len:145 (+),score=20.62 TRINITY_DN56638_c0_g1_i1:108-542(+)